MVLHGDVKQIPRHLHIASKSGRFATPRVLKTTSYREGILM